MIKTEICRSCGRLLYADTVGGLNIRTETQPLEADGALSALLGGETLYRAMHLGGRPSGFRAATPDVLAALRAEPSSRPHVVREHRCPNRGREAVQAALSRPAGPTVAKVVDPTPKARVAPSWTPSSVSPTPVSSDRSADSAAPRRSEPGRTRLAPCERCRKPVVIDGPELYAAIELGATVIWAEHETCP